MTTEQTLTAEVATIFRDGWEQRNGQKVPMLGDLCMVDDAL